jgi:hypothetical protein
VGTLRVEADGDYPRPLPQGIFQLLLARLIQFLVDMQGDVS